MVLKLNRQSDKYFDIPSTYDGQYKTSIVTTIPHLASHEDLEVIKIYPPSSTSLPLPDTGIGLPGLPKIPPSMTPPSMITSSAVSLTEVESDHNEHSEWASVDSPLPDPAEYEYELTYRLCLSHEFPRSRQSTLLFITAVLIISQ